MPRFVSWWGRRVCTRFRMYPTDSEQSFNLGGFLLSDWEMYIDCWGEKRYFCLTGERGCKIPHRNIMSQIFKMRQWGFFSTKRRYKISTTICFWNEFKFVYLKLGEDNIHILWFETKIFAKIHHTLGKETVVHKTCILNNKSCF